MKLFYTNEELPQRSKEWLKVRETCIGASELGTVLGMTDKYETAKTLWRRKTKRLKPKKETAGMKRGTVMEEEAKEHIITHLRDHENIDNPILDQYFAKHPKFEYLGVSFDGVDLVNKYIVELKCPTYVWNFRSVLEDGIQDYYYPQVQSQLWVAKDIWGIDKAYFCSYWPEGTYVLSYTDYVEYLKKLAVIDIEFDETFCLAMNKVAKKFWDYVQYDEWQEEEYQELIKEFKATAYGN